MPEEGPYYTRAFSLLNALRLYGRLNMVNRCEIGTLVLKDHNLWPAVRILVDQPDCRDGLEHDPGDRPRRPHPRRGPLLRRRVLLGPSPEDQQGEVSSGASIHTSKLKNFCRRLNI